MGLDDFDPECGDDGIDADFETDFANGTDPIVFDPDVNVMLQNPVLVEMMKRGPKIEEIIWTGCTGACVQDILSDGRLILRGRDGESPLDIRGYVPAFGWGEYCWLPGKQRR